MNYNVGNVSKNLGGLWGDISVDSEFESDSGNEIIFDEIHSSSDVAMDIDETIEEIDSKVEDVPSRRNWTKDQVIKLSELIKKNGKNWPLIVKEMNMPKSRCYSKWVELKKIDPELQSFARGHLWDEKVALLVDTVKKYGTKNWKKIEEVVGLSATQCRSKWIELKKDSELAEVGVTVMTEEEKAFVSLVEEHGTNWSIISPLIDRTTTQQCAGKWQFLKMKYPELQNLGKQFKLWSSEERGVLMQLIKQHGTKNWKTIAEEMGLTVAQCKGQLNQLKAADKTLRETFKSLKKWTKDDDEALKKEVISHGTAWKKVAEELNLTASQCENRWGVLVKIDPTLKDYSIKKKFSEMEDRILADLVKKHEKSKDMWVKIGAEMKQKPTRCESRWKYKTSLLSSKSEVDMPSSSMKLKRRKELKKR